MSRSARSRAGVDRQASRAAPSSGGSPLRRLSRPGRVYVIDTERPVRAIAADTWRGAWRPS
jgi:hypothetical protein